MWRVMFVIFLLKYSRNKLRTCSIFIISIVHGLLLSIIILISVIVNWLIRPYLFVKVKKMLFIVRDILIVSQKTSPLSLINHHLKNRWIILDHFINKFLYKTGIFYDWLRIVNRFKCYFTVGLEKYFRALPVIRLLHMFS